MKRSIDYLSDPVYSRRLKTDCLFEIPFAAESDSVLFETVRFLEKMQLTNTELWRLFVHQFVLRPDAADSGWRGEYWGKMMRAACLCARVTGNPDLYSILASTVSDLLATADPDGRIASYPRNDEFKGWDMWSRKYVLLGCEYFLDICDDEPFRTRIIEACKKHLDCILAHIGEEDGKRSILTTSEWWGCMNSCSILEPVVRLYDLTGEKRYLDFAAYIVSTGGSNLGNILELAYRNEVPPYRYPVTKAYETMSFFEGILEYYRVTGNEYYKTAVLHFTDSILATDYTIIGSCGCTHELFDHSSMMQTEANPQVAQETCVAVTLLKLLYQVFCLTGEAKYAEAMERTYYNSILGSINFNGNVKLRLEQAVGRNEDYSQSAEFVKRIGGFAFDSYSPLYKSRRNRAVGGYKAMENGTAYGCCACIGAAGAALLPLTAVMAISDGILINHCMNGTFRAAAPNGTEITLKIETQYPYGERVRIIAENPGPNAVELKLRVPSGGQHRIQADGRDADMTGGSFAGFSLTAGRHEISAEFCTDIHTTVLNRKIAIEKGCIVLAADSRNSNPDIVVSPVIAEIRKAKPDFRCRECWDVTFGNGAAARLVDYASAGADWDSETSYMTAWFDTDIG